MIYKYPFRDLERVLYDTVVFLLYRLGSCMIYFCLVNPSINVLE